MTTSTPNAQQEEYWNGEEGSHWVTHQDWYDRMLRPFIPHLLEAAGLDGSHRVVDIGCGSGATSLAAARRVHDGEAVGVDLSRPLLRRAEQRARESGVANVRFEQGDAQVHAFAPATFDAAISRFGIMFFADPAAAFANIARALRPGGRTAFLCWQDMPANEWIAVPAAAALQHVALPAVGDPDGPGPFALRDADRLRHLLDGAGLTRIDVQPVSEPLVLGPDAGEAVAFLEGTGMGKALLKDLDAAALARVTSTLEDALEAYVTPDGVRLGSAAWLATATRPT